MDNKKEIAGRLATLRAGMKAAGIDAAIVPQADPHHSEYLADHWQLRRWLSGFTGSAGTLVVTATKALLWTDSRYFLQAAAQLEGTGIELMKEGLAETPSVEDWLCHNLAKGSVVGIDGTLMSIADTRSLAAALGSAGIDLKVDFDPAAGDVWPGRPALPLGEVIVHPVELAGEGAATKIAAVLANARAAGAHAAFLSDLAEIAWVLNVRSDDVAYNPVVTSHLYLSPKAGQSVLFVDARKLTPAVRAHLDEAGVGVRPYEDALAFLAALPADERVLVSTTQVSGAAARALGARAVEGGSPAAMLKAVKNDVQIACVREAMRRDGVAMVRALREIEATVAAGKPLTEMDIADVLVKYRKQGDRYMMESFETIAGFGPHGAIVHYAARPDTNSAIDASNLLLIDSGANYLDGTTDITRTISLGTPTPEQVHDFTLVMLGHIRLAMAVYPEGTHGHQLDAIARQPLWNEGKLYLHGTGHGVGFYLNVHEGPHSIRLNDTGAPLQAGCITSNEPGLYLEGRYGIRCENLVLTVPAMTTDFGRFLRFETLTLCPFDRKLFDTAMMSRAEIEWLDSYHARVYDELAPALNADEREWLRRATLPLEEK